MIEISKKIQSITARIGIIGLGYRGLPLAIEFAKIGYSVTGFDSDAARITTIGKGVSSISDVPSTIIKILLNRKTLAVSADFSKLKKMDVIIVCEPIPVPRTKGPEEFSHLSAAKEAAEHIHKGQLIVMETTSYPGATRELVLPLMKKKGLRCGKDFYLAFSPGRVDPGNPRNSIHSTTKIIGGITPQCGELTTALFNKITTVYTVSSPEIAEAAALLENTFRTVNVALVNELALLCDKLKIDVWQVIDAASTKSFGFVPFYPGPGVGGLSLMTPPYGQSENLKIFNSYSRITALANEMNSKMPDFVAAKIIDALIARGIKISKSKVLLLGVAYKKDVGEVYGSPTIELIRILSEKMIRIDYFDQLVPSIHVTNTVLKSLPDLKTIGRYDAVAILTNHTGLDYKLIVQHSRLIIDSRNATKGITSDKIIKL
ncbi:MAG: nucleotide sugar dehydrogenase [Elusimicrobia bacterium]|nr:nucleotide sugar dehydrogenase [Elusimicrobiota bacterium]